MTRHLLTTVIAALALVAAGCGGGDESSSASPTEEWAEGLCTAYTTWTDSLQSITEQFSSGSLTSDALTEAANDAKSSTESFLDDLRALGAPDTLSGEEVKTSIDELSTSVESEVAKIETAANDVSGLTSLPSAITAITTSVSAMTTAFASTVQTAKDADVEGELRTALEDSPACADIPGSG